MNENDAAEYADLKSSEVRPAVRFLNDWAAGSHFAKVREEFIEVQEAYRDWYGAHGDEMPCINPLQESKVKLAGHLMEELADLQMACETMMAAFMPSRHERREIRRMVIEKNKARGYYVKREYEA